MLYTPNNKEVRDCLSKEYWTKVSDISSILSDVNATPYNSFEAGMVAPILRQLIWEGVAVCRPVQQNDGHLKRTRSRDSFEYKLV